jgi:hypothetical protein
MGTFSQQRLPYVLPLGGPDNAVGGLSPSFPTLLSGMTSDQQQRPDPNFRLADDRPRGNEPAVSPRTAVPIDLPGLPEATYLDSEFAPKVNNFIKYAKEEGMPLTFSSGYRSQDDQTQLRNSGAGLMPAKQSLHSAGSAVDVNKFDGFPESSKLAVRRAAERAGLSWRGTFGDDRHFYVDPIPGQDRTELINNFTEQVRRARTSR